MLAPRAQKRNRMKVIPNKWHAIQKYSEEQVRSDNTLYINVDTLKLRDALERIINSKRYERVRCSLNIRM